MKRRRRKSIRKHEIRAYLGITFIGSVFILFIRYYSEFTPDFRFFTAGLWIVLLFAGVNVVSRKALGKSH